MYAVFEYLWPSSATVVATVRYATLLPLPRCNSRDICLPQWVYPLRGIYHNWGANWGNGCHSVCHSLKTNCGTVANRLFWDILS